MTKAEELRHRYVGDAKERPKAGEYLYHSVEPLLPIMESWTVDEWGDLIVELNPKLELSAQEFIEILESLIRGGVVLRSLEGTITIKLTEY